MLKTDSSGKVLGVGYQPGKSATLVRNPNWNAKTDYPPRPTSTRSTSRSAATNAVIGQQVLEGTNIVAERHAGAVHRPAGLRKIHEPAGDLAGRRRPLHRAQQRRRAVHERQPAQGLLGGARPRGDGQGARWRRSSPTSMTHFIYPAIPGFEQAGGLTGPKVDFNEHPEGDLAVAEKYMKLAGYPSGKYTGNETHQDRRRERATRAEQDAEIVNQALKNLGFKTKLTLVDNVDDVREVLRRARRRDRRLPERRLDRRLRRPADGPRRPVQRQLHHRRRATPTGARSTIRRSTRRWTAAESVAGQSARASAWAKIDEELVENAVAIPLTGTSRRTSRAADVGRRRRPVEHRRVGLQLHLAEVGRPSAADRQRGPVAAADAASGPALAGSMTDLDHSTPRRAGPATGARR